MHACRLESIEVAPAHCGVTVLCHCIKRSQPRQAVRILAWAHVAQEITHIILWNFRYFKSKLCYIIQYYILLYNTILLYELKYQLQFEFDFADKTRLDVLHRLATIDVPSYTIIVY